MTAGRIDWRQRLAHCAPPQGATLMEVCGTHTMTARRAGIHHLLPDGVRLLSGPGCPVCVTPVGYVDHAIALAMEPHVQVACYGDLVRVPGSRSSLEGARAAGGRVQVVYSAIDALELARQHGNSTVVFLGVGFETTAPTTAAAIVEASETRLHNFRVLTAHRVMPPALEALVGPKKKGSPGGVDGFIAPGHVSAIIGIEPYRFVAEDHHRPVVIAGFTAEDMLRAIEALLEQLRTGRAEVENLYRQAVRDEGNPHARAVMDRVFEPVPAMWRGLGEIDSSGLTVRARYARHRAEDLPVELLPPREPRGCRCGIVLRGELTPQGCSLFGKSCTPIRPVGACMVSTEGACNAAYRYGEV